MKNTKIPFCSQIPESWIEIPNKFLFEYRSSKVGDKWKDYQLLSLTTSGVKTKNINSSGGKVPDSYDKYQTVEPGDMVFCLFDLDVSAVFSGLSPLNGMITSAYDVVRPNINLLDQAFSDYWFRYVFSNRYYKMYSKNIRYTITSDMFKSITTPIPPLETQRRIGKYLDKKCGEINELIVIEKQQIDSLKEYKQALITQAITKGLKADAKMKNSNISWVGEIPYDFMPFRIKFLANVVRGGSPRPIENYISTDNNGYNWIKIGDTEKGNRYINSTKNKIIAEGLTKTRLVHKGDLILTNSMSFGEPYILNIDGCIHDGWLAFSDFTGVDKLFMYYCLQSNLCLKQFEESVAGGIVQNLNIEKVKNAYIYVPPIETQKEIIDYLDEKCTEIEQLIGFKNKKIDSLEDYKRSIIYEFVTGKKEVIA